MTGGAQRNTLTWRLERLERDVRYWKCIAAAALVSLLGLAAMAHSAPRGTVEARAFVVRSPSGQVRAGLGVLPNGLVSLTLFDGKGRARLGLGLGSDGSSGLRLVDEDGRSRAVLGVGGEGWASLDLYDRAEQTVWSVWAAP